MSPPEGFDLHSAGSTQLIEEADELLQRLFPICRSITGDGVRQTLSILQEVAEFDTKEIASGTTCYDWVVPESYDTGEYEIRVTSTSDKSVYGTSSLSIAPFFPNIFGGLTELTLILVAIVLIILIIIWKVTSKKKPVQQKIVTENNSRLQALKGKVNEWKKEGYDVKEIEDMMDSSETLKENKTSTNKTK